MSSQRYERVANNDEVDTPMTAIPNSPPPSFRSRDSSIDSLHDIRQEIRHGARYDAIADQTLADTFDADGADSDEENEGDDRQRLMRGSASRTDTLNSEAVQATTATDGQAPVVERNTHIQAFAPTVAGRVYGGGMASDGVFANLNAKPEVGEKLEEHPPTYEQAAADVAPPYWETTIGVPGLGGPDDVYIDGLPVGSLFSFLWNAMISLSFQLVGFILTYLLHTTHAAKNGSRAGLGITLIQYGFYMKNTDFSKIPVNDPTWGAPPPDPTSTEFDPDQAMGMGMDMVAAATTTAAAAAATATETAAADMSNAVEASLGGSIAGSEWLAYALMIVGWFILIRAISDFLKARRHEQLVLQSPDRGLSVPVIAAGETAETVV